MTTPSDENPMRRNYLRWKKNKQEWMGAPRTFDFRYGGECVATVQQSGNRWFWYGEVGTKGRNTAAENVYFDTLEQAKADCESACRVKR